MQLKICLGIMLVFAMSLQGCGRKGALTLPRSYAQDHGQTVAAMPGKLP